LRRFALLLGMALAFGCTKRQADPAPPAASAELPTAPPKALGARAASLEPPPPPSPFAEEPEEEEQEEPGKTGPDDAAVPLAPDAGAIPL
jgi:hypothetical protein